MKKLQTLFFVTFFTSLLGINFAFAHERQVITIGGADYLFVIGSLDEPVIVGDKTGIDLRVFLADPKDMGNTDAPGSKPVLGLEKTLKVENISGNAKKEFPLTATWGKPGSYQTIFYPTTAEPLWYRVSGTIASTSVDLLFTCNIAGHVMNEMSGGAMHMKNGTFDVKFHAGSFGCPKEKADYLFPQESSHSMKEKVMDNVFGIAALILMLAFIVLNRSHRR